VEPMTTAVEVWPVAADEVGIWLLSGGDALRGGPVMADACMFAEVGLLLEGLGVPDGDVAAVHSTSWRQEGPRQVDTFMAVIAAGGLVRNRWPAALPVTADLAAVVGKPFTHAASGPPTPRYVDVLMHGLRHLHYLVEHDATAAAALGELWRRHLGPFEPALAGMYDRLHHEAV